MPNSRKVVSIFVTLSGWLSSILPGTWATMIAAVGGTSILWMTAGARFFTSPEVIGTIFIVVMILWTCIGLVWLTSRKLRDVKTLRYGLTFEGISPNWDPTSTEGALSFALFLRNYSPAPLRYVVEDIDVHLDTRTLPTRYVKGSLQGILPRGAGKMSSLIPFKFYHIREFIGKRVEGTLDFSVTYGDADRAPVRRFTMTNKLWLEFPSMPDVQSTPGQLTLPLLFSLKFSSTILSESDEPMN